MALETPSWLDPFFTERILRLAEDDNTLKVIDIFVKPATAKGDNYTSDMMRVVVEFTRTVGDKKVNDKKPLIFKFEPIAEGRRRDLIEKTQIFDTEIAMMSDALKKMTNLIGTRLGAQVYHIRMERPLCLIMEDLAPLGFRMADRQIGLDLPHCRLVMQGLARFHAASVALCEKEPKHKAIYRRGIFNDDEPSDLIVFFKNGCITLANEVQSWSELGKKYADKIRGLADKLHPMCVKLLKRRDDEFNVINHGDCWVNNMMFRYDENSKPIEHVFVDFQLCVYNSPVLDLIYFITTSMFSIEDDIDMERLLLEYVELLTHHMAQLNCKTAPPTLDEIKQCKKNREFLGLIYAMTALPIMLVDKSEAKDIDEMIPKDGEAANHTYKNSLYKQVMIKRLPKYDEMGLLDI
ncbi:PREDICTED: uncharacterized protein LOC107188541 [Dufourea novaeangliae]|uniref:CHK kinase-like domain-containing protein n=1 Tax=Dufourea novaeangliae TaxID=178035 RepID=A0A154PF19_DUFNO|nr:PREDICTED: uncharacterized protein LOC107188541 [Dufourea novaeangliae]KZC10407.1 hypothetical protein WN55_01836 [Dufourea novaeangliae]